MFAYCLNNPVLYYDPDGYETMVYNDRTDGDTLDGLLDAGGGGASGAGCSFANASNALDAGYTYHVDLSQASNSSSFQGGIASNGYIATGYTGGEKTEIHHIVEQCQRSKSGFSNSDIQAASNKIELPYSVHRGISGHYSSIQGYTDGMRVRNWLAGKSFEFQTEYGWRVISMYMR